MKTTTTFISAIVLTISTAFAQQPDQALSRVTYNFVHIQDTTQRDKPYAENMLLVIGKNASVYTSYDKIVQNENRKKQIEEQMKNQSAIGTTNIKISAVGNKQTSALDYFYFAKENKFYIKERVFNNYLIDEPIAPIEWKITKDTMNISEIACQKATAHFKGRNWIAWYAPELPFQSGPWKLNGLPGLIIEAYDDKKEVQFLFAGMENVNQKDEVNKTTSGEPKIITSGGSVSVIGLMGADNGNEYMGNEIKLPADAIKATRKEIDQLKEAREKDPQGFFKTQMAGSGSSIVVIGRPISATSVSTAPKIVLNNPIELPEKK